MGEPAAGHQTCYCGSAIMLLPGWLWSVKKTKQNTAGFAKSLQILLKVQALSGNTGWQQQQHQKWTLNQGEELE